MILSYKNSLQFLSNVWDWRNLLVKTSRIRLVSVLKVLNLNSVNNCQSIKSHQLNRIQLNQMRKNANTINRDKHYSICPKMDVYNGNPNATGNCSNFAKNSKYLANYLYIMHAGVPFRYYRKVSVEWWKSQTLKKDQSPE